MVYESEQLENMALLQVAAQMCAAARTAPKAMGVDNIVTKVLTGPEKDALAAKLEEIDKREFGEKAGGWFGRDANNARTAQAVVLIGVKCAYRGVPHGAFCGFENCAVCKSAGGRCAMAFMDLGIALSSAVAVAAQAHVDNRIMLSLGKAAMEMHYTDQMVLWHAIPLSISGKNTFFDRK